MTTELERKAGLRILVVDDEHIVRDSLGSWLRMDGHHVDTAENAREALRRLAETSYDIVLTDIKMPGMDGLELQERLCSEHPDLTVIVMTAYASVPSAVRALKTGAYDYIVKPFDPDELSLLIRRAGEHRSLRAENLRLKESIRSFVAPEPIVGNSPAMKRVIELIMHVAGSDATVQIIGESGTGKELVARAIHANSPRRYNPLVVVNCGALPEGILESELFGHEAGAFTGARHRRKGKFEAADGGTIFLDEIGEISPAMQVALLRVLEDKVVTRLGGNTPVPVDFRVITATNRDLRALLQTGEFREDLYWRINVFRIEIPPLRERPEDIEPLARHFLEHFCRAMNRKGLSLSNEALEAMRAYSWPGNVRELKNAIERAVVLGRPPAIRRQDLPETIRRQPAGDAGSNGLPLSLAEVERNHIRKILLQTGWNITRAAKILGIDRVTLYNKIKRYGLRRPEPEESGGKQA
jgi:DNA-binding NtrC family response regulator